MPTSIFTYNLTRPYPYRWYTPLLILGFIMAAAFFSVVNYVSSGYTLQAKYLFDSNATTWSTSDSWLKSWPAAFVGNIKPMCQPSSIPVGTTTVTNNSALSWTITNVTLRSASDGGTKPLSSLVYHSNLLGHCQFRSVTLYLDSYLGGRNAPQISWSQWGAEIEGRMYCEVQNDLGVNHVNLTANYNLLPQSVFENNNTFSFPGRNSSLYSLWWGESLLSASWWDFVNVMALNGSDFVAGVITFTPDLSPEVNGSVLNPRALFVEAPRAGDDLVTIHKPIALFPTLTNSVTYTAVNVEKTSTIPIDSATLRRRAAGPIPLPNMTEFSIKPADPDVKHQAETLGLIFLSVMWTDLGQFHENNNILKNPELLFHFSQNLTEIKLNLQENQTIGPETAPYSRSAANDARLVINPSILVTDYLCQVPQRKPWGSLITSVLVADLVFLRTLWAIVTFVASYFAKKQSPLANSCESCLRPFDEEGSQEKGKEAAFEPSEAENSITDDCGQSQRSTLLVQRTASRSSVHIERVAEQNS